MVRHSWLLNAALEVIRDAMSEPSARADLDATVRALDPRFFGLFGDVLAEEKLSSQLAVTRGAAVVLQVASIQLADDLADGECSYLEDAVRRGPGAQALLQVLAFRCLMKAELEAEALAGVLDDLTAVGAAQQLEVRHPVWNPASYLSLAREINGRQHAAYLTVLCGGSQRRDLRGVGVAFGTCAHVVGDAVSKDARWNCLNDAERREVVGGALKAYASLKPDALPALRPHLEALYLHLSDMLGSAS